MNTPDDLIKRAEAVVGVVPVTDGTPLTDEQVMAKIKDLVDLPGMKFLMKAMIINCQTYAIIRAEMAKAAGNEVTEEVFLGLVQGLSETAMDTLTSIEDVHRQLKKSIVPWLRDMGYKYKKGAT